MALAIDTAPVQRSVAFAPSRADEHVGPYGTYLEIAEPSESDIDEAFLDAMTNVFGDHRPVLLPGRRDAGAPGSRV
jgi:hypothetical protein